MKAQLPKAGRSVHPAPHPHGRLRVAIYWATPGQSCLLTLHHQKFAGLRNRVKDGPVRVMGESTVSGIRPGASWDRPWPGIAFSHLSVLIQKQGKISALIVRLLGDNVLA